ncbi:cysteine proteinase [Aureobasidium subglaciale]|nr:cysteine proteinase [Aureobasidium subglaciale]
MANSLIDSIFGGVKRAFDAFSGNESDTRVGPHNGSEVLPLILIRSSNRTMHRRVKKRTLHPQIPPARTCLTVFRSPQSQFRRKRIRTQATSEARQVASLRYSEQEPRSRIFSERQSSPRQSHAQPSAREEQGASSRGSFTTQQRRTNHRTQISVDERRLLPGVYPYADLDYTREARRLTPSSETETSTLIRVPLDEWNTMSTVKRKPGKGMGFTPQNTLRNSGTGPAPLTTTTTRGVNVDERQTKRRKIEDGRSQHGTDNMHDNDFLTRGTQVQPSATLGRQSSVISVASQSQETPSQRSTAFGHDESRNVDRTLNNKKKSRKRKPSAAHLPSSPFTGTQTDPVSLDEDDEVQFIGDQSTPDRPARSSAVGTTTSRLKNAQIPGRTTEVDSSWQRHYRAEKDRIDAPRSPNLNDKFKRDRGEPEESPAPKKAPLSIKDKMQATSNPPRNHNLQQGLNDSSEDELALGSSLRQPARKPRRDPTQRSPSPGRIVSTHFTRGRRETGFNEPVILPVSSLRLKAGNWENLTMGLIYYPQEKEIHFNHNGEELYSLDPNSTMIVIKSIHAQSFYHGDNNSTETILLGAKDEISKGRIWLDFPTPRHLESFIEVLKVMNPTIKDREMNENQFQHALSSAETFFKLKTMEVDPEIQAMRIRQESLSREHTHRERTLAAQSGNPLPEPTSHTPIPRLTRAMRADFVNTKTADSGQDHSLPPPTSRAEQATPVRSSRRLQSRDDGKATRPVEPELERWTKTHGIPKWDAPLTYPAVGKNRTTIDASDIEGLDEGGLLNDNIISFCLREMQENHPELQNQAHIFNSFFYSTLTTTSSGRKGFNYDAVSRWTRTVDLFSHPFVAVPINANLHWFVVIICNLDKLARKLDLDGLGDDEEQDEEEAEEEVKPTSQPDEQEPPQSQTTVQNDTEIPESPQEAKDGDLSQRVKRISLDASQEEDDELPPLTKLKPVSRKGKRQAPPLPKMDPNTPALILLDSLSGSHPTEIKNLKQYVVHEGREKRSLDFDHSELRGMAARGLPQQTNFCDCGVYLIGYMEAFHRDPAEFVRKIMSRELDHDNDFADFDPSKKRAEIREKLIKLEIEQSAAKKQRKKEKARLLRLSSQENGSQSPALAPTRMSSPLKPPAEHTDSRMVQSSPMKPPPLEMQNSSPPAASSPSCNSPPTVDREPEDDMLFGSGNMVDFKSELEVAARQAAWITHREA